MIFHISSNLSVSPLMSLSLWDSMARSSAKYRSPYHIPLNSSWFIKCLIGNRVDHSHPGLYLRGVSESFLMCPLYTGKLSYRIVMVFTILDGIRLWLGTCHIPFILTMSKGVSKSIKCIVQWGLLFDWLFRCSGGIKCSLCWIWRLFGCSSRILLSTESFILFEVTT